MEPSYPQPNNPQGTPPGPRPSSQQHPTIIERSSPIPLPGQPPHHPTQAGQTQPRPPAPAGQGGPTRVREIGGFSLVRELGEGGMGKVFLARQKSLDRLVALKVLQPDLAGDEEFLIRFHREAKAAALFQHTNVVAVIDAGRDPQFGVHFIAFEFIDGGSLENALERSPMLPEEQSLFIIRGIAQALSYAESKGIVHRDVKPDNILMAVDGTPKLADLGLAKRPTEASSVTQTGIVLGTPLYMAPEQALGVEDLDIRADIYALGLCLWRMLSGLFPFDEERTNSSLQILTKHINEDLIDVRERNPDVSPEVAALVGWMVAREREDRYTSARHLARDIDRILSGEAPLGPQDTSSVATTAVASAQVRRAASGRAALARKTTGRAVAELEEREERADRQMILPLIAGVLVAALGIGIGLAVAVAGRGKDTPKTAQVKTEPEQTELATERVGQKTNELERLATLTTHDPETVKPAPEVTTPAKTKTTKPVEPKPAVTDTKPEKTEPEPAPKPKPRQPTPAEISQALAKGFVPQFQYLQRLYFVNPKAADLHFRKLLTKIPPAYVLGADKISLQRITTSYDVAKGLLTAKTPQERRGFEEQLVELQKLRAIKHTGIGVVLPAWIEELTRLEGFRKVALGHLDDPNPLRDLPFLAKLLGLLKTANNNQGALELLNSKKGRRLGRGMGAGARDAMEAIKKESQNVVRGMGTPDQRLRAHTVFVWVVRGLVNAIDHWPELDAGRRQWSIAGAKVFFSDEMKRTALWLSLKRELNEALATHESLRDGSSLAMALFATNATVKKQSRFLLRRLSAHKDVSSSTPLARGILVVVDKRKKSKTISVGLDGITLKISKTKAWFNTKTRQVFRQKNLRAPALQIEVLGDVVRVRRFDLKGKEWNPEDLRLALPKGVRPYRTKFRVKSKVKGVWVVPAIGPPAPKAVGRQAKPDERDRWREERRKKMRERLRPRRPRGRRRSS